MFFPTKRQFRMWDIVDAFDYGPYEVAREDGRIRRRESVSHRTPTSTITVEGVLDGQTFPLEFTFDWGDPDSDELQSVILRDPMWKSVGRFIDPDLVPLDGLEIVTETDGGTWYRVGVSDIDPESTNLNRPAGTAITLACKMAERQNVQADIYLYAPSWHKANSDESMGFAGVTVWSPGAGTKTAPFLHNNVEAMQIIGHGNTDPMEHYGEAINALADATGLALDESCVTYKGSGMREGTYTEEGIAPRM